MCCRGVTCLVIVLCRNIISNTVKLAQTLKHPSLLEKEICTSSILVAAFSSISHCLFHDVSESSSTSTFAELTFTLTILAEVMRMRLPTLKAAPECESCDSYLPQNQTRYKPHLTLHNQLVCSSTAYRYLLT